MSAIAYLRVSSTDQGESGLGLAAQEASIRSCAARLNLTLQEPVYRDVMSGTAKKAIEDREGLLQAIAALARGFVLIVAKLDRLSRGDIVAAAMIERLVQKKGARIISACGEGTSDDDPSSVLMRRICQGFAEYEAALISTRTKAALRAKRARGEVAGRTPYGFSLHENGSALVINPAQQSALTLARTLRAARHSYAWIADALNQDGHRPQSAAKWTASGVRSVLATVERQGASPRA